MAEFIDISVAESITERILTLGWDSITDAEREVYQVYMLQRDTLYEGVPETLRK